MSADGEMKWAVQFVLCQNAIDILRVSGSKKKIIRIFLVQKTKIYIFEKIRRNGFSFEFKNLDVKFLGVVTHFVPFDKPG